MLYYWQIDFLITSLRTFGEGLFMSLGKRLVLLRKRNAMTQEQLAQLLGTTRQAVSKWESEKSTPDVDSLIRIGSVFHVSMDYLLLGEDTLSSNDKRNVPISHSDSQQPQRYWLIFYSALLSIGISVLLLLPLIASIYKSIATWPKYTNANLYLREWPLLGVVILGIIAALVGCCGIIWPHRQKIKQQLTNYFA